MDIFKQNDTLGFKCELHRDTGHETLMFNLLDYDNYTFDAFDDDVLYSSYKEVRTDILTSKIHHQTQSIVSNEMKRRLINVMNEYYNTVDENGYVYKTLCVYYDMNANKKYDTNYCEEIYNIMKQYHDSHNEQL